MSEPRLEVVKSKIIGVLKKKMQDGAFWYENVQISPTWRMHLHSVVSWLESLDISVRLETKANYHDGHSHMSLFWGREARNHLLYGYPLESKRD